jgi:TusA-related sulfurtransferase
MKPGVVAPLTEQIPVGDDAMTAAKLDVRGEICPYPMMRTVSALKKLSADEGALEVITDHAPALETIPTQAARLGFRTDIEESGASEWLITITRTQAEEEV